MIRAMIAVTLLGLRPAAMPAQSQGEGLLAAPTANGVSLRWVWPEIGPRPLGYHVERREPGASWSRVSRQAVVRVRGRDAARALVGEAFPRYESLLFPASPLDELADPETQRSLLLLAADVEPGVARALGLRFDDTAAASGRVYEYRLLAVTDAGERPVAQAGPVTAGSFREAQPPDSLEADQPPEGVALRWNTTGAFTAYHVFRRRSAGAWTRLNVAPVVVFSADGPAATRAPWFFRDTTARVGDTLGYAVAGIDPFGRVSRHSAEARLVVRDVAPPARPPQVSALVAGDTVRISWVPSPDASVASYRVWRAADREGPFAPVGNAVPRTALADPGRTPGLWWYRVTALDRDGNESDPSFVAMASVPDLAPPPAPSGVTAVADTGRITLSWQPVPAADLRGYRVYRASSPTGAFGLLTPVPLSTAGFADTIRRGADQAFHYRVTAVDSAFNESAASPTLAARPPDLRAPSPPRMEWVRPCEDCLVVRWFANPEADVAGYRVRYRPRGDTAWRELPAAGPAAGTVDTIPGLEARRLYEVTVVALDDAGNSSPPARPVAGEPIHRRPPAPLAVRRLAYDAAAGGVLVEWNAPAGVERVRVERRDRETGTVVTVAAAAPGEGRAVDRGAEPGREYEYALRAADRFGNSAEPAGWKRIRVPERGR